MGRGLEKSGHRSTRRMRFPCVISIFIFSFMKESMEEPDLKSVRLGDAVTLGCTISHHVEITWMRHEPDHPPTVVLVAKAESNGRLYIAKKQNDRISGIIENRSISLNIKNVTNTDFALYYCAGKEGKILQFGKGTRLQASGPVTEDYGTGGKAHLSSSPEAPAQSQLPSAPPVYPVYAALLGCGQLAMICAVVRVHLKSRRQRAV